MTEDTRLILEQLNQMDGRLNRMDARLDQMDGRLDKMDARFDQMDERLDKMDAHFDQMDGHLKKLDAKTDRIQIVLESEIRKNISVIAEGHLDLSRKLSEIIKAENQKEILMLRMNYLESEMRDLKASVGTLA